MNTQGKLSNASTRTRKTWLTRTSATLDQFREEIGRKTELAEWPHSTDCAANILIYDGEEIARAWMRRPCGTQSCWSPVS